MRRIRTSQPPRSISVTARRDPETREGTCRVQPPSHRREVVPEKVRERGATRVIAVPPAVIPR